MKGRARMPVPKMANNGFNSVWQIPDKLALIESTEPAEV